MRPRCSRRLAWLPSLPPANVASTQEQGQRPRQQEQRVSLASPKKRETLESLRKVVAGVAANPGHGCSPCVGDAASARRGCLLCVCWRCCRKSGVCLLSVRWRCRGLPPVPVLSLCCPPSSPAAGGGWSWCRLAAVSVCCPVCLAVVGASRATRGRLASTQGCHRCSCRSPWARPLALRTVGCRCFCLPASTQRQHRPRQRKQRSSANPLQKKKTQEKPAETRCRRCRAVAALGGPPAAA